MEAVDHYEAWRIGTLEVWYHHEHDRWEWRLLHGGGETTEISQALDELYAAGDEILPHRQIPCPTRNRKLCGSSPCCRTRDARRNVRHSLDKSSPGSTSAGNLRRTTRAHCHLTMAHHRCGRHELLAWMAGALSRQPRLQILIGYGIEPDSGKDQGAKRQRATSNSSTHSGVDIEAVSDHRDRQHTRESGHLRRRVRDCHELQLALIQPETWSRVPPRDRDAT